MLPRLPLLPAAAAFLSASAFAGAGLRTDTVLADGWTFSFAEKAAPGATDAKVAPVAVTLPHNYGWQEAQLGKKYYRGPAVYQRVVDVPASAAGKRAFLRFEAASSVATVIFNGKTLGEHRGPFGAFAFEITNDMKPGSANTLEVRTDNTRQSDIAPLSGDFCIFGGLYRPVHLIVTDEVCITPLDYGSPGVAIRQTKVSADEAVLDISTQVSYLAAKPNRHTKWPKNGVFSLKPAADAVKRTLVFTLADAEGKVVARDEREVVVQPYVTPAYEQRVVVKNPHRWNGRRDPYLYTATVELREGDTVLDGVTRQVGLRSVALDTDKGFFLNGERLKLRGVNIHQDRQDKGWALSPEDESEDIGLIADMGANAIRAAHYQHSEHFYELCDRAGMLVWAEIPTVNEVDPGEKFEATQRRQLTELIRQNLDHPSIFTWGLHNEVRPSSPDPHAHITDLHRLARAEDPSRPTIAAASHNLWPEMNRIPDWLGFNHYPYWYAGPNPGKTYDMMRAIPRLPAFCVSEYGAGAGPSQHQQGMGDADAPAPGGRWHPEEWQSYAHENTWKAIAERDFIWGSFLWNMCDFVVHDRKEGERDGLNDKGLVTHDRKLKKDTFFFYRANWNPAPTLYIASRRHVKRGDATTTVRVYSNAHEVELKLNGARVGVAKPNALRIAEFPGVKLAQGKNGVEVSAVIAGATVTDSCAWEYVPGLKEVHDRSGSRENYGLKDVAEEKK